MSPSSQSTPPSAIGTLLGLGSPYAAAASGNGTNTPAQTSANAASTNSGGLISNITTSALNGLFSSRVVSILLGLLLIGGALFLFGADEFFESDSSGLASHAKTAAALAE